MNINLVYAKTHQAAEILHIFENKTAPLDIKGVWKSKCRRLCLFDEEPEEMQSTDRNRSHLVQIWKPFPNTSPHV
jgi:hypothetical protein